MLLYYHQYLTDTLNMQEVANDFICAREQRCNVFIILSYFPPLHTHIHSSQPYHSTFCNYTPVSDRTVRTGMILMILIVTCTELLRRVYVVYRIYDMTELRIGIPLTEFNSEPCRSELLCSSNSYTSWSIKNSSLSRSWISILDGCVSVLEYYIIVRQRDIGI